MALEIEDKAQYPEETVIDDAPSEIECFLQGRNILVSGGIGFMGKVLIEKLLYTTAEIGNIYVLIRAKRGEDPQKRLNNILQSEMFHRVRPYFGKIVAVPADVAEIGLALSPEWRRRLCDEVSVVFHAAATTRFNASVTQAVLLNTRGTKEMLDLAKDMRQIVAFVHVSTTYCNPDRKVIDEQLYPAHADWRAMVRIAEKGDADTLSALTGKIIGGLRFQPNTYTFSKSLAEHVVKDYAHLVPCVIFRPSIVISSDREPLPGWLDHFNGPGALLVAGAKGIIHSTYMDTSLVADFIPVDIAIKAMIISAWQRATQPSSDRDDLRIYNASTAVVKPVTVQETIQMGYKLLDMIPTNRTIWLSTELVTTNYTLYYTVFVLLQLIPAIIVDIFLKLIGHKFSLLRVQRKVYVGTNALSFFMTNSWQFINKKFLDLDTCLKGKDRLRFSFKFEHRDVFTYFYRTALGGRRYLLKEKDEDIPKAQANLRRIRVIHFIVTTILKTTFCFLILNTPWMVRLYNSLGGIIGLHV